MMSNNNLRTEANLKKKKQDIRIEFHFTEMVPENTAHFFVDVGLGQA